MPTLSVLPSSPRPLSMLPLSRPLRFLISLSLSLLLVSVATCPRAAAQSGARERDAAGEARTRGKIATNRPKAKEAIAQLQRAARSDDGATLERALPAQLFAARTRTEDASTDVRRAELARELATAKIVGVREDDDQAIARYTVPGSADVRELPLRHDDEHGWVAAAAQGHVVDGQSLDARRGKQPARATLRMRTSNDGYGGSALSFAHVTASPADCKNRMDVFYCHNGDLHGVAGSEIAGLGRTNLAKVVGLPLGASWASTAAVEPHHVYVVHCRSGSRHDFFVKLQVVERKADAITLEWTLLSDGPGAPPAIDAPQPVGGNDGADGADGLCAKKG